MATLRTRTIRLAHGNPELRGALLPLLKAGSAEGFDAILQETIRQSTPGAAVRDRLQAHIVSECTRVITEDPETVKKPHRIEDAILATKVSIPIAAWLGALKWTVEKCLRQFDITFVDISAAGSRVSCSVLVHTGNLNLVAVEGSLGGRFLKNVSLAGQPSSGRTRLTIGFTFQPTRTVSFWVDEFTVSRLVAKTIRTVIPVYPG